MHGVELQLKMSCPSATRTLCAPLALGPVVMGRKNRKKEGCALKRLRCSPPSSSSSSPPLFLPFFPFFLDCTAQVPCNNAKYETWSGAYHVVATHVGAIDKPKGSRFR